MTVAVTFIAFFSFALVRIKVVTNAPKGKVQIPAQKIMDIPLEMDIIDSV